MTEAQKVARNSLVQFAGRGVTMGASIVALALLSQYLGPHRYGQYQLVIAFLTLVNVSDLGVATIAVRHLSTTERDPDELMANVLTVRTVLALVSSALAIGAAWALGYPSDIKIAIAVASLSFPLTIFSGSFNAAFAANLRMEYAVIGNIAQTAQQLAVPVLRAAFRSPAPPLRLPLQPPDDPRGVTAGACRPGDHGLWAHRHLAPQGVHG
jgi:O-antigen/teichoic acid export membrane protein